MRCASRDAIHPCPDPETRRRSSAYLKISVASQMTLISLVRPAAGVNHVGDATLKRNRFIRLHTVLKAGRQLMIIVEHV